MDYQSQKTVKVQTVVTSLKTVKGNLLPKPEKKGKYSFDRVVGITASRVSLVDKSILEVLIRAFHEDVIELASAGFQIDAGLVQIRPAITGVVDTSGRTSLKNNKLKVVVVPGKQLRLSVSKTKLRMSRNQDSKRTIYSAENAFDKNEPIVAQGHVLLSGRNFKIVGDFPECGVWLENVATAEKTIVQPVSMGYNMPKSLVFKLPDNLLAGEYFVQVVTCYSGTKRLLKKPVIISGSLKMQVHPPM